MQQVKWRAIMSGPSPSLFWLALAPPRESARHVAGGSQRTTLSATWPCQPASFVLDIVCSSLKQSCNLDGSNNHQPSALLDSLRGSLA